MKKSPFACVECGHKFRTLASAERAAFGDDGCPKCGSSDIDLAPPAADESRRERAMEAGMLHGVDAYNDEMGY